MLGCRHVQWELSTNQTELQSAAGGGEQINVKSRRSRFRYEPREVSEVLRRSERSDVVAKQHCGLAEVAKR